ncbi:MAG: hypothetical protein LBQ95_06860 [Lachnospiraceae bacterium]|nr:hypothetical protein [Lachnospiraceae bacterium]
MAQAKKTTKKPPVEREIVRVSETKKVDKSEGTAKKGDSSSSGEKKGSSVLWRILAIVCWLLAVGSMIFGLIMLCEGASLTRIIGGIVGAAVFCIVGAQFWKHANRIKPANFKVKFFNFVWNQLGVLVTILVFLPIGIFLLLKSDKLDAKSKRIVTIVAAVLFAAATAATIDYNAPVVQEESASSTASDDELQSELESEGVTIPNDLTGNLSDTAYWTKYGKSYHFDQNCFTITRSLTVYEGNLADALREKKLDPCNYCAHGGSASSNTTSSESSTESESTETSETDTSNDLEEVDTSEQEENLENLGDSE